MLKGVRPWKQIKRFTVNVLPLICLVILLGMSVYLFVKNNKGIYPVDNTR